MIPVPLPGTIRHVEGLPRSEEFTVNLLRYEKSLISRPGITHVFDGFGSCRGRFVFNERLYHVSGSRLIRLNVDDNTVTDIGEITGENDIDFSIGFTQAVIIVKGGDGFILQPDETLTQIDDPDFRAMDEVAYHNGRFLFSPSDGGPILFSDVGDGGSIGSLAFFDAEFFTDLNRGVVNFRNDVYVLGTDSIQLFRNVGPEENPFIPVTGSQALQGYIAAKIVYLGALWFVGREQNQDAGIFALGQGEAQRVSNPAIDRIIQSLSEDELRSIRSQRIVWKGHDFLEFKLPEHSLVFYNGHWSYFQSVNHTEEFANWDARYAVYFKGDYYVGSNNERIGVISNTNTDFGEPIRRLIRTYMRQQNDFEFCLSSLSLAVSQGQSIEPSSIGLRLTDDGVLWTPRFFEDLTMSGDHTFRAHWEFPGGLGYYRNGFVGIELYTTSEVEIAMDGLTIYE